MAKGGSAAPAGGDPEAGLPPEAGPRAGGDGAGLPIRGMLAAAVVAIPLILLVDVGIRYIEVVTGNYITHGVPPVPALAALFLVLAGRMLIRRRYPRLAPDSRQVLLIYLMVAVGLWLGGMYAVRAFLPHLVVLQYWGRTETSLAPHMQSLPAWYAPRDPELARTYWEGSRHAGVPWAAWIPVLLGWVPFFLAVFCSAFCLMLLVRKQWLYSERLSFPLLSLPLSLASDGGARYAEGRPLLRHPLLWVGFGFAAALHVLNMGHALNPSIPGTGFYYPLSQIGFERPWTPLNTVMLFYMLEAIGFGYFVPLDITFSAWFLYAVEKVVAVGGIAVGYEQPGYPFIQEQCAGAYLACGILLLWAARRHLVATWHRAWEGKDREERLAWMGLLGCFAYMVAWSRAAGLTLEVALAYFALLGCFVLVYARIRAETGVPLEVVWPWNVPKELIVHTFSVAGITGLGGAQSMIVLSSLAWLSRHHLSMGMAAYQIDGLKLADQEHIGRRPLFWALGIAFVVGLVGATWAHLDAFHKIGANVTSSGAGDYRAAVAHQEYVQMASRLSAPPPRDWPRLAGTGAGMVAAFGMAAMRARIPGFPLHPLGFIIATAYGDHTTAFFPMFMAWFLKFVILRVGGLKLFRRCMPLFLGLIIGQFLVGGMVWPALCLIISPEATRSYHVYFGG